MEKEFAVAVDDATCINCGVCMDLCPIRSLDMTRTRHEGPESTFTRGQADPDSFNWMMEKPVQVAHCNGCTICVRECPTQAITIAAVKEAPIFVVHPGPILVEPRSQHTRWSPLSSYTRAAMKVQGPREAHDPWGKDLRWRIASRLGPWQVWRTWTRK